MKGVHVAAALLLAAYAAGAVAGERQSIQELMAAAAKNDPAAQNNLAVVYATGDGIKQDYAQAAHWYKKAGEAGYAVAQYNLGALYERGLGVPKDPHAAKVWYEMAAQQGDGWAQLSLGQMLASEGATERAYKWLYLASLGQDGDVKQAASGPVAKLAAKLDKKKLELIRAEAKSWRPATH